MSISVTTNSATGSQVKKVIKKVYLVLYGSGFLSPQAGSSHNTGDMFELTAKARHEINQKQYAGGIYRLFYCPTDYDFFRLINQFKEIARLDIYSHAWVQGLNLGGFVGKRDIGSGTLVDSIAIDWTTGAGEDLRHVNTSEQTSTGYISELTSLDDDAFSKSQETYIWGCNAGGQLDRKGVHIAYNDNPPITDLNLTFAKRLAVKIGKGKVYALVGKGKAGGSMFKVDSNGKPFYLDGELLPANIALNNKGKDTTKISAQPYLKEFKP